jgi:hypothetical protein
MVLGQKSWDSGGAGYGDVGATAIEEVVVAAAVDDVDRIVARHGGRGPCLCCLQSTPRTENRCPRHPETRRRFRSRNVAECGYSQEHGLWARV